MFDTPDEDMENSKASMREEMDAPNFHKQHLGTIQGMECWSVHGDQIRNGLHIDFTNGGNPSRYNYIPENELWVEGFSQLDLMAIAMHEWTEHQLMQAGDDYSTAHDKATKEEKEFREHFSPENPPSIKDVNEKARHWAMVILGKNVSKSERLSKLLIKKALLQKAIDGLDEPDETEQKQAKLGKPVRFDMSHVLPHELRNEGLSIELTQTQLNPYEVHSRNQHDFLLQMKRNGEEIGKLKATASDFKLTPSLPELHEKDKGWSYFMYEALFDHAKNVHNIHTIGTTGPESPGGMSAAEHSLFSTIARMHGMETELEKGWKAGLVALGLMMAPGAAKAADWTPDGLHPELHPIAHMESSFGKNMNHVKHPKGSFHTAFGAVGLKPVTAHEQGYMVSPELKKEYPELKDQAAFEAKFTTDHKFYNKVASAHWLHLRKKCGSLAKTVYAWRYGLTAALNAAVDAIKSNKYVNKVTDALKPKATLSGGGKK